MPCKVRWKFLKIEKHSWLETPRYEFSRNAFHFLVNFFLCILKTFQFFFISKYLSIRRPGLKYGLISNLECSRPWDCNLFILERFKENFYGEPEFLKNLTKQTVQLRNDFEKKTLEVFQSHSQLLNKLKQNDFISTLQCVSCKLIPGKRDSFDWHAFRDFLGILS